MSMSGIMLMRGVGWFVARARAIIAKGMSDRTKRIANVGVTHFGTSSDLQLLDRGRSQRIQERHRLLRIEVRVFDVDTHEEAVGGDPPEALRLEHGLVEARQTV